MRNSHRILAGFLAILTAPLWAAAPAELTKEQTDFFEGKIRPILSETCYKCHSIEKGKSKGSLTLDTKPGWEKAVINRQVAERLAIAGSSLSTWAN